MEEILPLIGRGMALLSIGILLTGCIYFVRQFVRLKKLIYLGYYLWILLIIESTSLIWGHYFQKSGLPLFSISFFVHYVFLTLLYTRSFFGMPVKWITVLLVLGTLPLIVGQFSSVIPESYQAYDRAIFSFTLMFYSMILLLKVVRGAYFEKEKLWLNASVFVFFAMDTFLAITSNYLINESLILVGWFWMGRAVLLQVFYVSLIYLLWKNGKTQPLHSYG